MWSRNKPQSDPQETVRRLRDKALGFEAAELGLKPTPGRPRVWGVIMETGYPEAVATLVVLGDGTTSLYFSHGGGVIGAGEHSAVRVASDALLSASESNTDSFSAANATPLPEVGRVRFYVRTFDGTLTGEAAEEELGGGRHPLSPVFYAAHDVITAVRESTPS